MEPQSVPFPAQWMTAIQLEVRALGGRGEWAEITSIIYAVAFDFGFRVTQRGTLAQRGGDIVIKGWGFERGVDPDMWQAMHRMHQLVSSGRY